MFNERAGAERCVREIVAVLRRLPNRTALIVVDDGSGRTPAVLAAMPPGAGAGHGGARGESRLWRRAGDWCRARRGAGSTTHCSWTVISRTTRRYSQVRWKMRKARTSSEPRAIAAAAACSACLAACDHFTCRQCASAPPVPASHEGLHERFPCSSHCAPRAMDLGNVASR